LIDDTLIASYLLDPEGQHGLDYLADKYLGYKMLTFDEVVPKKQTFADVPIELACRYSAADAWVAHQLQVIFQEPLRQNDLGKVYTDIEMPLVSLLAKMERNGILIDLDFLDQLDAEFTSRLHKLEKKIYELAGENFNINSPKQLSVILFEKLKLPVIKKTKTGFSTDVDVLEELAQKHDLPKSLLEFRTITKLLSTYVTGLKDLTDQQTHRLHTHFNQAVVATGRLSSSEPNLQNIPIKTEEGRRIREAFIAEKGTVLLSADYSQIELRLLAAFSKDPHLVDAYKQDQDIHAKTAAHIFDVPIELVEPYQRSIAKTINFGVIYGQSPFGLAQQLGVPQAEAKRFIEGFYHEFSHVRDFKEETLAKAREQGFVTTHLGRRRYLPEINSRNSLARQNAERMAFNTVFQGSAADLIKKAMIMIDQELMERKLKTKMLLQVHDELVFEVPENELNEVRHMVKRIMESAFTVGVPIRVSCATGKTWAEAHG
jgi:DNA polymerase-1